MPRSRQRGGRNTPRGMAPTPSGFLRKPASSLNGSGMPQSRVRSSGSTCSPSKHLADQSTWSRRCFFLRHLPNNSSQQNSKKCSAMPRQGTGGWRCGQDVPRIRPTHLGSHGCPCAEDPRWGFRRGIQGGGPGRGAIGWLRDWSGEGFQPGYDPVGQTDLPGWR
jgi:hypothetical protein